MFFTTCDSAPCCTTPLQHIVSHQNAKQLKAGRNLAVPQKIPTSAQCQYQTKLRSNQLNNYDKKLTMSSASPDAPTVASYELLQVLAYIIFIFRKNSLIKEAKH